MENFGNIAVRLVMLHLLSPSTRIVRQAATANCDELQQGVTGG
jgi:hypothetical protein